MLIKLNGIRSAEAALEKANLMWSVEQAPLITANGLDVTSHKALYRGDNKKVLGIVGQDYEIIQNTTAFSFFDVVALRYGARYEYAGIIKDGRKIFLQAKLGQSFEAVRGDQIDNYVTMVTSHDGSSSLKCLLTPIRLTCANMLVRAIKAATTSVMLKHTSNVNDRLRDAMNVFHMSTKAFEEFEQKAKYLARKLVDKQMVERFLNEVIEDTGSTRAKNQKERVRELFENGRGNTGKSAWHLYNGVTEWIDHDRTSDPEKSLDSAMFGSGASLKEKAFEAALAL